MALSHKTANPVLPFNRGRGIAVLYFEIIVTDKTARHVTGTGYRSSGITSGDLTVHTVAANKTSQRIFSADCRRRITPGNRASGGINRTD
jgi:hypothetical protein